MLMSRPSSIAHKLLKLIPYAYVTYVKCFDSLNNRKHFFSTTYTSHNLSTARREMSMYDWSLVNLHPGQEFFEWLRAVLYSADSEVYFAKTCQLSSSLSDG